MSNYSVYCVGMRGWKIYINKYLVGCWIGKLTSLTVLNGDSGFTLLNVLCGDAYLGKLTLCIALCGDAGLEVNTIQAC